MTTMPVSRIKVGKRIRRDMGDVEGLAADMADIGLLHPIIVSPAGKLLAGERRLRAAKRLGWETIEVTVKKKPNGKR
jgi:ParB family chromosome partitioning protein